MKKVLNISLGSRSFTLEEDAYRRLKEYLEHFRARLVASSGVPISQNAEVMDDLESRIAELFMQEVGGDGRVVGIDLERCAASASFCKQCCFVMRPHLGGLVAQ